MTLSVRIIKTAAAMTVFVLAGCVSLLPDAGPDPDIYRLTRFSQFENELIEKPVSVMLPLVQAPRALRNNRFALLKNDHTMAYAAAARWSEATPEMVQTLIADHLSAMQKISVVFPEDGVKANYELRVYLRAFEVSISDDGGQRPSAHVSYQVRLVDLQDRKLIAEKDFSTHTTSQDDRLGSMVKAMDASAHKSAELLADWMAGIKSPADK